MIESRRDRGEGEALPPAAAQVKIVACRSGVSLERDVPRDELQEYLHNPDDLLWVDVQDPGPDELDFLEEEFGFHPLALEDVVKGRQRPKVDEYKGYVFVVCYGVEPGCSTREVRTFEIDLFIGRNYVVSLHRGRPPALLDALARWTRGGELLREGVGFLVYAIMDAIIDSYFPVIDAIEDEVGETELEMFTRFRGGGVQGLLELKRSLFTLRRLVNPLREAFHLFLRRDRPLFTPNTFVYFQDVYDHILRILDVLEVERDMVGGAVDAYMSVSSNRLEATMKILTVVSVVSGIADCVFDAWGSAPITTGWWGWCVVIGGTTLLSVLALLISWKRGWL
jgi:magnesium transporter